jgi:tetratricopeptide (TPR) repeat protein
MIASLPPASTMQFWALKSDIAQARGDLKAARAALEASPNHNTGSTSHNRRLAVILLWERRYPEAEALIERIPELARKGNVLPRSGINPFAQGLYAYTLGVAFRAQGQPDRARAAFEKSRESFAKWLLQKPEEAEALGLLAVADAGCGRNADALVEANKTLETWPMSREPLQSAAARIHVAVVYAWTGDREAAIRLLEQLVKMPGAINQGDLKFNPRWDELRGDPRFNKIIEEAAKSVRIE